MSDTARRVVLASRPVGEPKAENFRLEEFPVPKPGPGEVLLRTVWLSLDPYMRGRMSDAPSYAPPVQIGQAMVAGTISEVAATNNPDFAIGDLVTSYAGWQTHVVSDGKGLRKIDTKAAPASAFLGVLGMPGLTAYTPGFWKSANRSAARPSLWRRHPGRWARWLARSRRSKARAPSALPAGRRNAPS